MARTREAQRLNGTVTLDPAPHARFIFRARRVSVHLGSDLLRYANPELPRNCRQQEAHSGRRSSFGGRIKTLSSRTSAFILTFIAGPGLTAAALMMGFGFPVGDKCRGAFADSHGIYQRSCSVEAQTPRIIFAVLICCGIALTILGIVRWVKRSPAPARSKTKPAPPNTRWPLVVGPLISVIGIVMGFTTPVGPHCSGAFAGNHMEAAGYDIAMAMSGDVSNASEACRAAAPGQQGIYFGIIGFGIAVLILGIVLRSVTRAAPMTPPAPTSVAEELARLAALRSQGILTDEEFEQQKSIVLTAAG